MEPRLRDAVLAASLAGAALLLAFFVWHWFVIAPVWTVLLEGAVGVALTAFAVGWAWRLSRRAGRFGSRGGGVAFGAVFASGLLLAEVLGLARGPRPDPTAFRDVLAALPFPLLPVVLVAVLGARLAGGWRGAAAYALAGLVLLLYLGGSIVQRGGVGLGLKLFLLLLPSYLAAGVIVGAVEPWLARRRRKTAAA